jgi:uncharacterized protein with HEPN domain
MDRRLDYLSDMRRAGKAAIGFVAGMQKEEFLSDIRTQHAIGMCLIVIGEATVRLMDSYPDFIVEHPAFPWHAIRGLRNRVAHGYFGLDLEIIWETTQTTIPELLSGLDAIQNWHAQGE